MNSPVPKVLIGVLAVLAFGALAFVLTQPEPVVPDVALTTLEGERVRTGELRGKVTVISFWSTTCGICMKEMPDLVARHMAFGPRGYETIAVAMHRDEPERVRSVAAERQLPYKVALDEGAVAATQFGNIRLTPTTFVVDREGRILKRYTGRTPWKEFDRLVEHALAAR